MGERQKFEHIISTHPSIPLCTRAHLSAHSTKRVCMCARERDRVGNDPSPPNQRRNEASHAPGGRDGPSLPCIMQQLFLRSDKPNFPHSGEGNYFSAASPYQFSYLSFVTESIRWRSDAKQVGFNGPLYCLVS